MQDYNLIVEADTNDADYVTEITKLSLDDEGIKKLKRLFKIVKDNGGWCNHDYKDDDMHERYVESGLLTEREFNEVNDYMPYGEYGIHTVESVILTPVGTSISLY